MERAFSYFPPPGELGRDLRPAGIRVAAIVPEGSIAAIACRLDDDDQVRQRVQQCLRDCGKLDMFGESMWIAAGLYQQLVGSWEEADRRRCSEWIQVAAVPEYIEGPNRFAHERRLSDRSVAELARKDILP